jgi:hypothetical protein
MRWRFRTIGAACFKGSYPSMPRATLNLDRLSAATNAADSSWRRSGSPPCRCHRMTARSTRCARGSTPGTASAPSVSGCTVRATTFSSRNTTNGWRATFYVTGIEHSLTSDTASVWEPTPCRAVQVAARDALRKAQNYAASTPRGDCVVGILVPSA